MLVKNNTIDPKNCQNSRKRAVLEILGLPGRMPMQDGAAHRRKAGIRGGGNGSRIYPRSGLLVLGLFARSASRLQGPAPAAE